MNEDTLKAALSTPESLGLAVYLFVLGELCDEWLSQTASHSDRITSAFTAYFFLRRWKEYLCEQQDATNNAMSFDKNGISHASHKIFLHLAESLLGLILAYRDYYPDTPLMPWKHGTEPCEHSFGWMRAMMPNFTVLDARQMMPKIFTVVKSVLRGHITIPKSEHRHSGKY